MRTIEEAPIGARGARARAPGRGLLAAGLAACCWLQPVGAAAGSAPVAAADLQLAREDGRWTARHDKLAFRTVFDAGRVRILPIQASGWELSLGLLGVERERPGARADGEGAWPPAVLGETVEAARLDWRREGGIREWYVHERRGLKQGFDLAIPPSGTGRLIVRLTAAGLVPSTNGDGTAVIFRDRRGAPALRMTELLVFDASGAELDAHFRAAEGEVRLVVDDEGARWPLVIDPLVSTEPWVYAYPFMGEGHWASWPLSSAGDVNGDGYDDVVHGVSAWEAAESRAVLFLGSADGLPAEPSWFLDVPPERILRGAVGAGDVNADGYDDVAVAQSATGDGSLPERVLIFHGSASGLSDTPDAEIASPSSDPSAGFGNDMSCAGDVNADGHDDLLVGATYSDESALNAGAAYLFLGSPAGLETAPAWTMLGSEENLGLGGCLRPAGDVDGDGHADVLVGTRPHRDEIRSGHRGQAWFVRGDATGLKDDPTFVVEGPLPATDLGAAVAGVGDLDRDGHADVAIGAPRHSDGLEGIGRVLVHLGTPAGLAPSPDFTLVGSEAETELGFSIPGAMDFDGDDHSDLVVAEGPHQFGRHGGCGFQVFAGSPAGIPAAPTQATR